MNHFRFLAIGTLLTFGLLCPAQQTTAGHPSAVNGQPAAQAPGSNVDQHLKALSEKLDLSLDQQAEIRPILQHMLDARQKLMQDSSLSNEAREQKHKALHEKAVKQARQFLNDDQKKKLDQLEQERDAQMHGNGTGTAPLPAPEK